MIKIIPEREAAEHPELMDRLHRLRYENFVVRRGWPLPCRNGRDIDQYDKSATHFVILSDDDRRIIASVRVNRTDRASLLADLFPHLIEGDDAPRSPTLFEGTRFTIDPSLRTTAQVRRVRALLCGTACRWMIDQGGTDLQAVVEMSAFRSFLAMSLTTRAMGLAHDYGGGPRVPGGGRCIAFRWQLTPGLLSDFDAYARGDDVEAIEDLATAIH